MKDLLVRLAVSLVLLVFLLTPLWIFLLVYPLPEPQDILNLLTLVVLGCALGLYQLRAFRYLFYFFVLIWATPEKEA